LKPLDAIAEKRLIATLFGVQLTFMSDTSLVVALLPQFIRVFELSPTQVSTLIAAYTVAAGVSGFFASFFLDRFERKRALIFLLGFYFIGLFTSASAPSYTTLLLARALTGVFGGVLAAVIFSIIGDSIVPERRGAATGKVLAAFPVSSVLTVPGGLILANIFSWRIPFYIFSVMALVMLFTAIKTVPLLQEHLRQSQPRVKEKIKRILGHKNHVSCYLMMMMQMFAGFSVISFFTPYLVGNVKFAEADIPTMYLVGGLFTMFTTPLIGKWVDKRGIHGVYRIVALCSLVPIFLYTNLEPSSFVWVLVVTTAFMVFVSGRMVPFMAGATSAAATENRGSHLSFMGAVQQVSVALAAGLSGMILSQEPSSGALVGFHIVGYVALGATVVCMFFIGHIQRHAES
jgi:predicted MFS family arabinose efflux permease